MVTVTPLPCDCDGLCMLYKTKPVEEDKLTCKTCATQWHVGCLSSPPATMADTLQWECLDCSTPPSEFAQVAVGKALLDGAGDGSGDLMAAIRAIEADTSLTELEKARKRQQLLSGKVRSGEDEDGVKKVEGKGKDVLDILSGTLNCSFCMQLPKDPSR